MVTILGRAKINLTLDILGLRDDGYHEIATVMQSLALADTLTLTRQEEGITLTVDLPGLEADERNLAHRAAALIMNECGVRNGVHIAITKRIPVAAGLAGGSADAGAQCLRRGAVRLCKVSRIFRRHLLYLQSLRSPYRRHGRIVATTLIRRNIIRTMRRSSRRLRVAIENPVRSSSRMYWSL